MNIVEVDDLGYDALDNDGYLQLDVDDEIIVSGTMTEEMFENRLFEARYRALGRRTVIPSAAT
jgi:hypothetical protein